MVEPEPRRQAPCIVEGGAREMTQAPWRNAENCELILHIGYCIIFIAGSYKPHNLQQQPACKRCWCNSGTNDMGVIYYFL